MPGVFTIVKRRGRITQFESYYLKFLGPKGCQMVTPPKLTEESEVQKAPQYTGDLLTHTKNDFPLTGTSSLAMRSKAWSVNFIS